MGAGKDLDEQREFRIEGTSFNPNAGAVVGLKGLDKTLEVPQPPSLPPPLLQTDRALDHACFPPCCTCRRAAHALPRQRSSIDAGHVLLLKQGFTTQGPLTRKAVGGGCDSERAVISSF